MKLSYKNKIYLFQKSQIEFTGELKTNLFSLKNNKTVAKTLNHKKYSPLREKTLTKYSDFLNFKLGRFLLYLKEDNDMFYREFLNESGDLKYSKFRINESNILTSKGIYIYTRNKSLMYIGRCKDSMNTRINQGYGNISPKNCYKDGQSTNCHLNNLISENVEYVELWFCKIKNNKEIESVESNLIKKYQPPWNIKGKSSKVAVLKTLKSNKITMQEKTINTKSGINNYFTVTIREAYLNYGYFNARIAHTGWFGEHLSSLQIQLGENTNNVCTGKIDRKVTNNNSPRIIAGVEYKKWVQKYFKKEDTFIVTMITKSHIKLTKCK